MQTQGTVAIALSAIPATDAATRAVWFRAVVDCHTRSGASWAEFGSALVTAVTAGGLPESAARDWVTYVEDNDPAPLDTMRLLAEENVDTLEQAWQAVMTPAEAEPEAPAAAGPVMDWNTFLRQFGASWDRDESSWVQFRTWFLYEASQRGLVEPAEAFLSYAEQGDKVRAFAEYQVPGGAVEAREPAPTPVDQYPTVAAGSTGPWVNHLDAMLKNAGF